MSSTSGHAKFNAFFSPPTDLIETTTQTSELHLPFLGGTTKSDVINHLEFLLESFNGTARIWPHGFPCCNLLLCIFYFSFSLSGVFWQRNSIAKSQINYHGKSYLDSSFAFLLPFWTSCSPGTFLSFSLITPVNSYLIHIYWLSTLGNMKATSRMLEFLTGFKPAFLICYRSWTI